MNEKCCGKLEDLEINFFVATDIAIKIKITNK